jgi:RNA polymerase sigma-70 factor (ECF subfamily)
MLGQTIGRGWRRPVDQKRGAALEQEILEALRRQDLHEATRRIVEGYGPQVLGYLIRTMHDETDASEVFSQLCEELHQGIGRFEGRSSVRTWVYRLATRIRYRFWQDPYRRRAERLATDEISRLEQEVRSRTLPFLRTEVKDRFAELFKRLDPEDQSLLTLRIDKEMSWTEIAEVLAGEEEVVPEQEMRSRAATLRQRFKRLKDKIRRLLERQGLQEQD